MTTVVRNPRCAVFSSRYYLLYYNIIVHHIRYGSRIHTGLQDTRYISEVVSFFGVEFTIGLTIYYYSTYDLNATIELMLKCYHRVHSRLAVSQ